MKIVGLIGFKQSGKSTAAKYLEEKYGFVRHNMKDALIAEIRQNFPDLLDAICLQMNIMRGEWDVLPWTIERLFEEKPPLMRALMVNYGTEVRRGDKDGYWVDEYKDGVEYLATLGVDRIVTDDCRFINEAKAIKELKDNGGILIRIIRTDITTGGDHSSETEQLQIEADYTIEVGPGEQEKLYAGLDKIIANETSR